MTHARVFELWRHLINEARERLEKRQHGLGGDLEPLLFARMRKRIRWAATDGYVTVTDTDDAGCTTVLGILQRWSHAG